MKKGDVKMRFTRHIVTLCQQVAGEENEIYMTYCDIVPSSRSNSDYFYINVFIIHGSLWELSKKYLILSF